MASVSAAAEGFDVPRLNCIILASPRATWSRAWANHENPCCRALYPLIIDPYDPLFPGAAKKRRALYKKRGYQIEKEPDDEDNTAVTQCSFNFSGTVTFKPTSSMLY
jgi:hypothetical protein